MNKTTKGSLAAGAAAVLLLGGAGSLAYWTDSAIVNGGQVNSGFLTLDAVPFETDLITGDSVQDCTDFVYAATFAGAGDPVLNFVPGDVISTTCEFVIGAEGDNLAATPSIPTDSVVVSDLPDGTSLVATAAASYQLGTTSAAADLADYTGAPITEDNDGDALVATIAVTFDIGTDETATPIVNGNDTQEIDALLSALTVSLTQVNPN